MSKNEYYYDYKRNCDCTECICEKKDLERINNKLFNKDIISVPDYYIGSNGYEARKVISGFDLSYNVGTAVTYLLRAGKKKEQGMSDNDKHIEDIEKAMNHLRFELEKLKN
jgi:hypothetical protein